MGFKKYPALYVGLGVTLLAIWLLFARFSFVEVLGNTLYDFNMKLTSDADSPSEIVLVNIDNDSIDKIGRWPWSRSELAKAITKINKGDPKLIGLNIIYSEPEENSGLKVLNALEQSFTTNVLDEKNSKEVAFLNEMQLLKDKMDNDKILAKAMGAAGNVVLPCIFVPSIVALESEQEVEKELQPFVIENIRSNLNAPYPKANEILLPIPPLMENTAGLGHLTFLPDQDGTARKERIIYGYKGKIVPSYALELLIRYLEIPRSNIQVSLGESLQAGSLTIPLTYRSEFLISFKGPRESFKSYSYFDVINDKIPLTVFKNKLVLIGVSAEGIINPVNTPTDPLMSLGEFSANTIWSLLHKRFIEHPSWGNTVELGAVLLLGLIVIFLLPRLKAMSAGIVFIVLLVALIGGSTYLFVNNSLWVSPIYPVLQLIIGYIGIVSIKYLVTETRKEKIEEESAESNRMLGISFQEQGRLDLAYDKLRRVPVDESLKETLYSLALDFERKRQYHKAVAVYEHIESHDPNYKDIKERKSRNVQVGETVVLGAGSDPLLSTSTDVRPTLGRYEVIKQLGKGAMGIVYLGKDPRINRTTAIKTFQFPDDIEQEEADQLKKRFFQEAESAGTLAHPNIVTIYDAGEENELAYIAMEFLEGHDMTRYAKPGRLLSVSQIVHFGADVADALDYAHQKGIVHRDIKPANIMLLDSGVIKITDFGIARITASSQTQTGVVKGTPHFMSPEQISGQKVDGRSDIFSLGVTLYQLLTGKTAFSGDNMAALMHMIINKPHIDPRKYNDKIPEALVKVLNNSLAKDREQRYQQAADMARHLRTIAAKYDEAAQARNDK